MTSTRVNQSSIYDSSRSRVAIWDDAVELFRYRDLLWSLVRRDLTVRYKRSVLGFLWTMLNPLLTMLVLTAVFSTLFKIAVEHFAVYLLSGLLLWNFFAQSTLMAISNLVWGGGLLNKIYIPKSIFVVSAITVGLVNLLLALIPLALIMLVTGQGFTLALVFLPVSILLTYLFALGVGLFMAAFAVFFVDVIDIYQVGLTILMYMTPIVYPASIVPPRFLTFIHLNPMFYFVELFRQPIYEGSVPSLDLILCAAIVAIGCLIIGWGFFSRKADEFAYRI